MTDDPDDEPRLSDEYLAHAAGTCPADCDWCAEERLDDALNAARDARRRRAADQAWDELRTDLGGGA
jgi:hypothetical protein